MVEAWVDLAQGGLLLTLSFFMIVVDFFIIKKAFKSTREEWWFAVLFVSLGILILAVSGLWLLRMAFLVLLKG